MLTFFKWLEANNYSLGADQDQISKELQDLKMRRMQLQQALDSHEQDQQTGVPGVHRPAQRLTQSQIRYIKETLPQIDARIKEIEDSIYGNLR